MSGETGAVCGHPSGEVMFGRCSACGAALRLDPSDGATDAAG